MVHAADHSTSKPMAHRSLLPRVRLHRPALDVLTVVCVVLVLAHVVVAGLGGVERLYDRGFYDLLGLSRTGVLQGKVWQFATHPFLHGSLIHLLLNWIVVFMIGGRVYHILGGRAFARIFFGGILIGSILHLMLHPRLPMGIAGERPDAPLVGASAAAMALLLALTGLSPDSRMWPLPVSGRNLGRGLLLSTLILFAITPGRGLPVLSSIGTWLVERADLASLFQIGHIYHFGGGLVGWWYARRLLRTPVSLEELQRARARREGAAA